MDTGLSRRWPRAPHPLRDLGEAWQRLRFRHAVRQLSGQIQIDLREDAQGYTLLASLPGVARDDIQVELDGNRVHISTASSVEHARHEGASMLQHERYVGRRERTLALPREIDAARAGAEYRHGVLKLMLPAAGAPRGTLLKVR